MKYLVGKSFCKNKVVSGGDNGETIGHVSDLFSPNTSNTDEQVYASVLFPPFFMF